ncbi:hypothetical protein C2S53_004136 [Perilla frutescens var. hirtella]|uniref:NB-ARC domain-containing protein n=1 Tax=Perilla frutescens var. hirtella TaxID=608512 RepID=A0AAD4JNC4_PERFH|nr:hypothetical protein C2S53_004136 [Perilla frutescens var. hirtella]
MTGIVASLVGVAIQIVKWVGAPIKRQFNYLCCFTSNINDLKHEAEELENAAGDLQGQVDRARDDVQVIAREVEAWLTNSNDIEDLKNTILVEVPNVESGCLKLSARFSLSKRAKKTTDRIKVLRGQCKFNAISQPGPPTATSTVPLGTTYEFESRKQIEEDIMTSLRGGDVNMIGICRMGGLGKTTMAKKLMNRALEGHLFDEVVMAVVSQPVDKVKIQLEIGGSLGLDLKDETSEASRVQKLRARLIGTKRILLVLDDVWERLVVEELGIPRGSKGCTILLTSRNRDVLSAMDVEKVFGMEVLSEEDSWLLFRGRAGTCVDDTGLNFIAKQVVEECRGLPIALTTVGATLKDEKNMRIWKDAVTQLRKANPTNIPDFIKEVYNPLKVSYNKLDSEEAKSLFLICCLFGEDAHIPLEYLTYFCMGLGIFEGSIEETRNRICTLTKILKSRSLLLDGRNEDYVRMHDVVRDVCIFIAKEEGYIGHNDSAWIFSCFQQGRERSKLSTNLRLLFLSVNSIKPEEEVKFDNIFVEGIRNLNVLCIERYPSLTSLPHTTESLKNLNSLLLYSCMRLETISVVGELVNLEILICSHCGSIKELPQEIKRLNRLKLLDLTECEGLQSIRGGIISSLVGLEELKMSRSFKKWEASNSKERENVNGNAELRELELLINLRNLEIDIEDPALVAENMRLPSNLERFRIRISSSFHKQIPLSYSIPHEFYYYPCNKKMSLGWEGGTCVGDWIQMQLLKDTECLRLTGNGANNVDYLANSENIRWLELGRCETMKNIGRTTMDGATVFPFIKHLTLYSLPQLEEIWDGPISSNSFHNLSQLSLLYLPTLKQLCKSNYVPVFANLSSIEIRGCDRLRNLGQLSIAGNDCLSQLRNLYIHDCKLMEQVFSWNEEEDQNINNSEPTETIMFPKLKKVELHSLPNLVSFSRGIESIKFPLFTQMSMIECPKMTSMVSSNEKNSRGRSNADNIDDHHSLHLFCQPQKVSFGNLKELRTPRNPFSCGHKIDASLFIGLEKLAIFRCEGNVSLFSSSIAANLVSLRSLKISFCDDMVEVIKDDEEKVVRGDGQRTLLFPKLQELHLYHLPKLVSFCEWKCDVELTSLRKVEIKSCPNMKYFTLGLLAAPNLEAFNSDLNNYLEIVKVIEDEEEKEGEKTVSAAAQTTVLLFPKLQKLELKKLCKLVSFCEWKFDVELPSLKKVKIKECPSMNFFTSGTLSTPKLEVVRINYEYFRGLKDLNGAVQQQFEKKQQEDKGGAEVQEIEVEELNS